MKIPEKIKKIPFRTIGVIVLILLSVALLWANSVQSRQATAAMSLRVVFCGEYKVGDGEWQPIVKDERIPAGSGDVTLHGYFQLETDEGESFGRVENGCSIAMYFDHIGGEIRVPGQETHRFDAENAEIGKGTCGQMWIVYEYTGNETDDVTIVLNNPHTYGNARAIDDFLGSMHVYTGASFENRLKNEGTAERTAGFVFIVAGVALLGIALYAALLRLKQAKSISLFGLMVCAAGGYFVLNARNVSLWSELVAFNTTALGLCGMFYTFFLLGIVTYFLSPPTGRAGTIVTALYGAVCAVSVLVPLFGDVLFFDTLLWRVCAKCVASVALLVLLGVDMGGRTEKKRLWLQIPSALALGAGILDCIGVGLGWWRSAVASEIVFILLFAVALVLVLRVMPQNLRAAAREKELLVERSRLQAELQDSRVKVMLSQIQPHFLYNTLNTIYHLCGKDAATAQGAIDSFSDYLRNNLDSLDCKDLVTFDKELQHVKTYLELEKFRFGDELTVEYDIKCSSFSLPILTVQPLVENAVKHGVSKKRGGGTVRVTAEEKDDCFEIAVLDTGAGFDPAHAPRDGKSHVGIESVRRRLQTMCGGTLAITSEPGKGTTATVRIPKKEGRLL